MTNCEENIEKRIIETAKQQFIENGFDKTSISDIAASLGINRPTLHYYFRTKEKLFQTVFGDIISKILPHIQTILNYDEPFFNRLERVIDVYLNVFLENPMMPRFIMNESHRDMPHLIESMCTISLDNYLSEIGKVIHAEIERGTIKRVPLPIIFLTFYSQLTFPFLTKKLSMTLFFQDENDFEVFIEVWKKNLLMQMRALLEI